MAKLHLFGVATKAPFADNSRAFRLLIASVTDGDQVLPPGVEVVLEVVRNNVSERYPSLMQVLYPGDLTTASKPFGSIDEMWLAFGGLSTNKTPTINNEKHCTLRPLAGLSLHSHASRRTQGRSVAPQSFKGPSGSSRNPIVMNVAASGRSPDPFLPSAAEWPANSTDWDGVFQVSKSFPTKTFHYGRPLPLPKKGVKSLGRPRVTVSTAMARITHLRPALPRSPTLDTVSTPR